MKVARLKEDSPLSMEMSCISVENTPEPIVMSIENRFRRSSIDGPGVISASVGPSVVDAVGLGGDAGKT